MQKKVEGVPILYMIMYLLTYVKSTGNITKFLSHSSGSFSTFFGNIIIPIMIEHIIDSRKDQQIISCCAPFGLYLSFAFLEKNIIKYNLYIQ